MALAVSSAVTVPSVGTLSGRLLVAGCVLYGWLFMLWWQEWPLPAMRTDLLLAATCGVVAGRAVAIRRGGGRLGELLPATTRVDLLPILASLAALVHSRSLLQARTPVDAVSALLSGWDNALHLNYIETVRQVGSTQTYSAQQGFDSYIAMLMELADRTPGDVLETDLVLATQAQGVAVVVGVAVLASALIVHGTRRSFWLCAVVVTLLTTMFLAGTGGVCSSRGSATSGPPWWQ